MKVAYRCIAGLPALAWIAIVDGLNVEVIHGCHVETRDSFFVEGAWNGDFASGSFTEVNWFCGTGAIWKEMQIVFSTPTHVTHGLFYAYENQKYYVSNSAYLLTSYVGYSLDSEYAGYEIDFNSIRKGLNHYQKKIRVLMGNEQKYIHVIYFSDLEIFPDGTSAVRTKAKEAPFVSFNDYETRLLNAMTALKENASDKSRGFQYGIVTTISKGYDAPCCAVIARKLGATTACTFEPVGKHAGDCGADIAEKLGFENIVIRHHDNYKSNTAVLEAEVVCSGELGSEISMASFYDQFAGNVVFTGERGDSIWDKNAGNANTEFCFDSRDASLGSSERRLWVDYIACPMPLFGATAWPSILKISNSDEMKAYSTGNDYDRPIPRRIVENAGVSRDAFGNRKYGAGFSYSYDWESRILRRMSDNTANNFKQYLKKNKRMHLLSSLLYYFKVRNLYLSRIVLVRNSGEDFSEVSNPTAVRYLIPWAAEHIANRYSDILKR